MKNLFICSPQTIEHKITQTLEYFDVEDTSDIDFNSEENHIEIEIEEREVEDDFNNGISRHTYTDAFDFKKGALIEYLERWFKVKFVSLHKENYYE